jgi:hypothetical protein
VVAAAEVGDRLSGGDGGSPADNVAAMYCSFYLRKGIAFLPTMAKTEAGYWLMVQPVDVEAVGSANALQKSLMALFARGNPTVQTPTRRNFPRPIMERYCGMKSLSVFKRTATYWSISQDEQGFRVYAWRRSERYRGAWEENQGGQIRLPVCTPLEEVARSAAEFAMSRQPR